MKPAIALTGVFVLSMLLSAADAPLPAVYKSNADLMAVLKESIAKAAPGAMATSGVANQGVYRINVVRRTEPGPAGAHSSGPTRGSEVHYIMDGSATIVTGGTIKPGVGGASSTIEGGVTQHVSKGDVVVIPEGTPHWYKQVDGSVTYLGIRFAVDLTKK